jgi:hypothetical protein
LCCEDKPVAQSWFSFHSPDETIIFSHPYFSLTNVGNNTMPLAG